MERIAAALLTEISTWNGVTAKPMFGMTLLYRHGVAFALLPKTRSLDEEDAILIKNYEGRAGRGWNVFAIGGPSALSDALERTAKAYEEAARKKKQ